MRNCLVIIFFIDGVWSLIASRENSVSNAVFNKTTTSTLTLPTAPSFTTISGFTQLFNNTGGFIAISGNNMTLQEGQYVVNVELNITTSETNTGSIGNVNGRTHVHFYSAQLFNGSSAIGGVVDSNSSSNTSGSKSHIVSFTFAFTLTSPETVSFQLARRTGGTYTGAISINDAFIQTEKSLLK
ncbi:hypothetical protein QWY92_02925 [Algibacter miyuki]|uniref:hypothetical protein n=1 Tax=Algibacter miyuki TaxID=1306933 RepID=UPI0025B598E4|nr:hypothetical protein [Algibacter miyuki]MDN3664358.1 hypothetical protein [Algibacter miyuki]